MPKTEQQATLSQEDKNARNDLITGPGPEDDPNYPTYAAMRQSVTNGGKIRTRKSKRTKRGTKKRTKRGTKRSRAACKKCCTKKGRCKCVKKNNKGMRKTRKRQ